MNEWAGFVLLLIILISTNRHKFSNDFDCVLKLQRLRQQQQLFLVYFTTNAYSQFVRRYEFAIGNYPSSTSCSMLMQKMEFMEICRISCNFLRRRNSRWQQYIPSVNGVFLRLSPSSIRLHRALSVKCRSFNSDLSMNRVEWYED